MVQDHNYCNKYTQQKVAKLLLEILILHLNDEHHLGITKMNILSMKHSSSGTRWPNRPFPFKCYASNFTGQRGH